MNLNQMIFKARSGGYVERRNAVPLSPDGNYLIYLRGEEKIEGLVSRGVYDWWNKNINSTNYSISPHELDVNLHIWPDPTQEPVNDELTTLEIAIRLEKEGLCTATTAETLLFGVKYPDIQRKFSLAGGFANPWFAPNGSAYGILLNGGDKFRYADVAPVNPDRRWPKNNKFLVKKFLANTQFPF